jgi:type II secretory pathway component PulK
MRSRPTPLRLSSPPATRRTRGRRRGSTFLLVLSVLALAILISVTLTYIARLDVISARNFVDSVGARIAVNSGLAAAPPFLSRYELVTARTQLWAKPLGALSADDPNLRYRQNRLANETGDHRRGNGVREQQLLGASRKETERENRRSGNGVASAIFAGGPPPRMLQDLVADDLSGKLNINAAGSVQALAEGREGEGCGMGVHELMLERALAQMLEEANLDPSLARNIALDICEYRLGEDLAPGLAGVDDNANSAKAQPGGDGIDNDRDGEIDNLEEADMAIERAEAQIPWIAESLRRLGGAAANRPSMLALEGNGLDDLGLGREKDDPAEGMDEPAERFLDVRQRASGDDKLFPSVEWLRGLPSVTEEVYQAIAPHVTTFSLSKNAVLIGDEAIARLNLNRASFPDILARLRSVYGADVPDRLLVQFACNIADARDPDRVRTQHAASDGTIILGVEKVPFITEVYPDSRTLAEDGDDGQFIEIHNPWDEEISLEGWTLEVSGRRHRLSVKRPLPAGGWVIITDDADDRRDPASDQNAEKRQGSFFAVFGLVASPPARQISELSEFVLDDRSGVVRLLDARGELVDEFRYNNSLGEGSTQSHQRLHPALNASTIAAATPFAQAAGAPAEALQEFFSSDRRRDSLFASPADLMEISSAWVAASAETNAAANDARLWQRPTLAVLKTSPIAAAPIPPANPVLTGLTGLTPSPSSTAPIPPAAPTAPTAPTLSSVGTMSNLDAGLVDLFYLGPMTEASAEYRTGLININTAPAAVLMALPGMTLELADAIAAHRETVERRVAEAGEDASGLLPEVPFSRPSELLSNESLWPATISRADRIKAFSKMANLISVSSSAFEVASVLLERDASGTRLVRQRSACGVVALDEPGGGRLIACGSQR